MRIGRSIAALAVLTAVAGAPAAADEVKGAPKDVKAAARATAAKMAKAVVHVKLVLKIRMGGREAEQKLEVIGTVIDPSGLTVVPASAVEPTAMLGRGGFGGRRGQGGGGEGVRPEAQVVETALVLDDGTEVDADVVLKDADLDLAFVRPHEAQKMPAVELSPRGKAPEVLEDIFTVTRLGRGDGRAPAINLGMVRAVVKGPRTVYVCTPEVAAPGCIAWGADGAPLGVFVLKVNEGEGGRFGGRDVSVVLRPVEDLLEVAKQAKEAKTPERKAVAAKEDAEKSEGGEKSDKAEKPAEKPKAGETKPEKSERPAEKAEK